MQKLLPGCHGLRWEQGKPNTHFATVEVGEGQCKILSPFCQSPPDAGSFAWTIDGTAYCLATRDFVAVLVPLTTPWSEIQG